MKNLFKYIFLFLILIELSLIAITFFFDFDKPKEKPESYFLDIDNSWADTIIKNLSIDEKIGQLFIMELDKANIENNNIYDSVIQQFNLGGIKFRQTEALNQILITNYLQAKSKHPLWIGSEGSIINQPDFNLPIGPIVNSVKNKEFINFYFEQFSEVLKHEGVNIDFSNSLNKLDSSGTIYGFSNDDSIVNSQSVFFRKKIQNNSIISCSNFNDDYFLLTDSILTDSLKILKKKFGIEKFFGLQISDKMAETIKSKPTHFQLDSFLKQNYGFKGLIFSNIQSQITSDELFALFHSGTDAYIINGEIEQIILSFKSLVSVGKIKEAEINRKVKRLLLAKTWAGLDKYKFSSAENNFSKILGNQRKLLSWKMYENSVCLLKNQNNLLPFNNLLNNKTHLLVIGKQKASYLEEYLGNFMDFTSSLYKKGELKSPEITNCRNLIIVFNEKNPELINDELFKSLINIKNLKNIIVVNFGNESILSKLKFGRSIIYTYDNHPFSQIIAAQIITGSMEATGQINPSNYKKFFGSASFHKMDRLQYTIPEAAGFNSIEIEKIEKLIQSAINSHAMPGCQILASKDGKVFFNKTFGYHTYEQSQKVKSSDIYDIASISKVAATTLASMKLYEEHKIGLYDSLKYYIEDTINCTIKNHQLRDFFLHQSGLPSDMPILKYIRYRNKYTKRFDKYYSEKKDTSYSLEVAENYFLRKDYLDSIKLSLYNLEWDTTKAYNYSDINFNIIYDVITKKIEGSYTEYLDKNFYMPLQLRTIGFQPLKRFDKSQIIPTQDDKFWRKQLLLGYPHDESAAIYGGISGNAGLFSNANDMAILFQMFLNGGTYGGTKVLNKETVEYFTSAQDDSPRGLGFARSKNGQFGHSGFTGCIVWANPSNKMIFIFLSNSIHPNVMNKKLKKYEIREKAYDLIMRAYEPGSDVLKIEE